MRSDRLRVEREGRKPEAGLPEAGVASRLGGRNSGMPVDPKSEAGASATRREPRLWFEAAKDLEATIGMVMVCEMPTALPVSRMSTADKLRAMEELWVSLTTEERPLKLPSWHRKALLDTEERVQAGKEEFIDWDEAKKSLRRRTGAYRGNR
jgi:hypothetical protein